MTLVIALMIFYSIKVLCMFVIFENRKSKHQLLKDTAEDDTF